MKNKMNIVFSVDDKFCPQLAVTIVSVLLNSDIKDEFNFFVLDGGINVKNKNKIEKLKKIKPFNIQFLKINNEDFKNCPVSHHFKIPTWYRIKLPSILNLDKILYMDCDIIVRKSLKNLYCIDLKNHYAAACNDIYSYSKIENFHKLKVTNYFNAGILLLNLKKMRDDNIEQKCFEFVKNTPEKICWVDQCVLNAVFNENVIYIDDIYNFQHNEIEKLSIVKNLYNKLKSDIIVLHFASNKKPWHFDKPLNFILEYYYYLFKTPFRFYLFIDILNIPNNRFFVKIKTTANLLKRCL